ncbi:hypothetical protein FPV67DRAFT_1481335 [Lyophyllum atratum]|nr:hypothetical protein FPV67DRAFT_1481335 [Lyophyllum atratum]
MSSVPSSSRPSSPTKPGTSLHAALRPNPHPYAIKTTSTGILSRSGTTSTSVSHSRNHYVPLSPSPSPTKATHPGYAERGSRHRYSRSLTDEIPRSLPVPPEELYYQHQQGDGHTRSRAETLPAQISDPSANPKLWSSEQLAENVPEIADFVQEHEITGRAFLRFDEGVLNAYGVTQQWQRSLLLAASRRLRQSVLKDRIWPNSNPMIGDSDALRGRHSHSQSLSDSPTKSYSLHLPDDEDDEDQAYLSSSSMSSSSSISGRRKRRYRPNGRVNGMVASFERSSSVDDGADRRERSGSISSVEGSEEPYFYQPHNTRPGHGRPLPYPPHPSESARAPLLLPTSSFPDPSFSPFNTPNATGNGNGIHTTPHATGNGMTSANGGRPLPSVPSHPSLRSAPSEDVFGGAYAVADARDGGKAKNTSGEMSMDELIAVLNADLTTIEDSAPPGQGYVNTDRRREKEGRDKQRGRKGAAAWEMDFGPGETVKRAPPSSSPVPAQLQTMDVGEELSVEELLALEGGVGAAAWVDESEEVGRTMKRVEGVADGRGSQRFGSISKGSGKGADRISLSAGRRTQGMGKKQTRRVGELFAPASGSEAEERAAEEEASEAQGKARVVEAEEEELKHMREIERRLLRAEEEERERWNLQAEMERNETRVRLEEEEKRKSEIEAETQRQRQEAKENRRRVRAEEVATESLRREGEEQRLASSIAEAWRLLEAYRGRLEEVEHRVAKMEAVSDSTSSAQAGTTTAEPAPRLGAEAAEKDGGKEGAKEDTQEAESKACAVPRLRMLAAWALSTSLGATLPAAVGLSLAGFAAGPDPNSDPSAGTNGADSSSNTNPARRRRDKAARIRALYPKTIPRYALLIGIGVCAVVLRGLMRWGVRGVRGMGTVGARGVRGR